jgi:excisionase family DNA binding protein
MTSRSTDARTNRLLTPAEAADYLNTSERFIRRLIAERRITFVKLGRHVRLAESDLIDFIDAGRITPLDAPGMSPITRRIA